jgi:D-alanyl-D-alanine carboxypeptidase
MRRALLLVAACALPSAAAAEDVRLCNGRSGQAAADGRLLNHFPYTAAARGDLVRLRALAGQCQAVHRGMLADLEALLARARADPEVGRAIYAISCYRTPQHQTRIFCRHGRSTAAMVEQAWQIAPPGFSEHATGLAIDFGDRRAGRCNLEGCFANSAVGRWLARNARDFGFEMSFPQGNAQGVAFEPWHWRWVGRGEDSGSQGAKAVFAAARDRFPATGPSTPATVPARPVIAAAAPPANAPANASPPAVAPAGTGQ